METPFMVLRLLLSFSYSTACKENVNLCFNAKELHVLCWADKVLKSKKFCSMSGFIACEGNYVQSHLCLEIIFTISQSYKMNKPTLFS